jgi:hypothetical protein
MREQTGGRACHCRCQGLRTDRTRSRTGTGQQRVTIEIMEDEVPHIEGAVDAIRLGALPLGLLPIATL